MKLKENDIISSSEVFILENGEPVKKDITELLKNKKVVLFGLPGAYTSVCSAKHLPGYINLYKEFKEKGIDYIFCISVNDPYVMNAWGKLLQGFILFTFWIIKLTFKTFYRIDFYINIFRYINYKMRFNIIILN